MSAHIDTYKEIVCQTKSHVQLSGCAEEVGEAEADGEAEGEAEAEAADAEAVAALARIGFFFCASMHLNRSMFPMRAITIPFSTVLLKLDSGNTCLERSERAVHLEDEGFPQIAMRKLIVVSVDNFSSLILFDREGNNDVSIRNDAHA